MSGLDAKRLTDREKDWSSRFTGKLGFPLYVYAEQDSVLDTLTAMAAGGAPAGTLVLAERQRRGRGRLGRRWESPAGASLLLALLLRPGWGPQEAGLPLLAASLALVRAAAGFGATLQVKWPNDVLHEGRKVAGVLAEGRVEGDRWRHLCLGMGVNVHQEPGDFPAKLLVPAASLDEAAGFQLSRGDLLAAWLEELEALLDAIEAGRATAVVAAWKEAWPHAGLTGVDEAGRRLRLDDVTAQGALVVEGPGGREILAAGDVSVALPAPGEPA
ncbi:MAG: biotin--[acetyl-CoA-carboxylase] ligase [Candidatus Krumholzibacteriota bacterium]|nr:biotin--[acetyl-CoA-carboxylase] ligase [Candidatus Krumholzibacteriota bacterium]